MHRIYNFISSMKTGLVLLLLIGLASAIGSSLLPYTFFQTPFFELLLLLLLFNMILCTINRIKRTYRVLIAKTGSRVWLRQLGVISLHLGIVLILIGGLVYSTSGQNDTIHLMSGDQVDMAQVLDIKHPFTLQLDEFRIEFNEDGSPSQYISEVTVLEQGQAVERIAISVNYPLNYRGVKAYQSSFGHLITTQYVAKNGAEKVEGFLEGQWLEPADTDRKIKVYKYIPNFDPNHGMVSVSMRPDNPHIVFSVYEDDKLLGVGAAKINEPTQIDENTYITFSAVEPYTILDVKADPGLPVVLVGGIILMLGVCLALLAAPVRKKKSNQL